MPGAACTSASVGQCRLGHVAPTAVCAPALLSPPDWRVWQAEPMASLSIPFRLRNAGGRVHVSYEVNGDPERWGYHLVNVPYDVAVALGCPVVRATVDYPAEGYAAVMGWVQVVRSRLAPGDELSAFVDVPPQMREADMPFAAFGIRPSFFDAPSTSDTHLEYWQAETFLTYSPDAVVSPVLEPLCGFRWGYEVRAGVPRPTELVPSSKADWLATREQLGTRYPSWTFG